MLEFVIKKSGETFLKIDELVQNPKHLDQMFRFCTNPSIFSKTHNQRNKIFGKGRYEMAPNKSPPRM